MPSSGRDRFLPLCPLTDPADSGRYLDIDDSQRMFDQFVTDTDDPQDLHAVGQLVLVTGERGCGKTSLINRCASWLHDLPRTNSELVIVNLVDQLWKDTEVAEERVRRTFGLILAKLAQHLSEENMLIMRQALTADVHNAFAQLESVLAAGQASSADPSKPIVVIVPLPCYPTAREVTFYSGAIGPGMIFFAEIWDPDQVDECVAKLSDIRSRRIFIQHLKVGKLKPGDAKFLVEQIRQDEGTAPGMPQAMLDQIFKDSLIDNGWPVLELRKLLRAVLRIAASEAAPHVTQAHVGEYYREFFIERQRPTIPRLDH